MIEILALTIALAGAAGATFLYFGSYWWQLWKGEDDD